MIVLIRNLRVQLYLGLCLLCFSMYTRMHMPQGFGDHVLRCGSHLLAFFLLVHPFLGRQRFTLPERILSVLLLLFVLVSIPAFVLESFRVRSFPDR